ncbi:MAG: FAD-dependent monooxygenase [Bacteroidota bacterium]
MKITIIGAGIGGLTTSVALQQKGIDYEIFESFPTFKDLGAGILLANNAMQVYESLGLAKQLQSLGQTIAHLKVTDNQLIPLSTISIAETNSNDLSTVAIHRSRLQKTLLAKIPNEKLHLGKRLESLVQNEEGTLLKFVDGSTHQAAFVLGADGIHSRVRKELFGNTEIRDANQICWRGLVDYKLPTDHCHEFNEAWGKGKRFGFATIGNDQVYWFALRNGGEKGLPVKSEIQSLFADFHPLVRDIIEATPASNILTNPITDLKPIPNWHQHKVCLIGDAAHATTPNMGQGACQSIEDAYVLANCLTQNKEVTTAFTQFQQLRQAKANKVVNTSWNIGKMAQWSNGLLIGLRNWGMRMTPKSVMKKQNAYLYELPKLSH